MVQDVSPPPVVDAGPPPSEVEDGPDGPPGPVPGVPLARLLAVATLSPAEASFVALGMLGCTGGPCASERSSPEECWAVRVTRSGEVEATRVDPASGASVAELLGELVRSARRLPAHPAAGHLLLLRRLEEVAAAPGPDRPARAERLGTTLVEVLGADAAGRLGARLADLVDAYSRMAPGVPPPLGAPAGASAGPAAVRHGRRPPAPRRPRRPRRLRRSRPQGRGRTVSSRRPPARRATLVVLILVVALAGSGYVLTRRTGGASADAEGGGATTIAPGGRTPGSRPSAKPSSRPGIRTLAPGRAGAVVGVRLLPLGECSPGQSCGVTVTAHLRPASTARTVTWRVGTATSCRSEVRWSAPVSVTARPGWTTVYASSSVLLPPGRSVGLVAATTAPARAQSPPMSPAGSTLRC